MIIRNHDELLSHGNIEGRRQVLDILETGLAAGDPMTMCAGPYASRAAS
jgi:hypothetical protein